MQACRLRNGAREGGFVLQRDGVDQHFRRHRIENAKRNFGADAGDGLQMCEPRALFFTAEPEQADRVFAHMRFDEELHGRAYGKP